MRKKAVSLVILCLLAAIPLGGCGQPKPTEKPAAKEIKELSPGEVVRTWNDALTSGDVRLAASLTSSTSADHVRQNFGTLEQLSAVYQKNLKNIKTETKIIHEEISGDTAVVVYRVQYGEKSVKYWMDKLRREDGVWKTAPQFVQTLPLKE